MEPSVVRAALASAVDVIGGLSVTTFAHLPDSIDPPVFIAGEVEVLYDDVAEGGYDEMRVTCHLYTSTSDSETGQKLLDGFLARTGAASVKAAIEADRTLGGIATTTLLERASGYGKYRITSLDQPELRYYGARLTVRVWGS